MNKLYGAILGDLCGQPYEFRYKGDFSEFQLHDPNAKFTDDTIMTLATAYALLYDLAFDDAYKAFGVMYPGDYYGKQFKEWINTPKGTINNSYGNGCIMRISPIMYLGDWKLIAERAVESCVQSHSHPKSIIACLELVNLYRASGLRKLSSKYKPETHVKKFEKFEVEADNTINFVKNAYYLSNSTTDVIQKVVACGGDTDTNASILGELMNFTFNDLTKDDIDYVESKLDPYLLNILHKFNDKF